MGIPHHPLIRAMVGVMSCTDTDISNTESTMHTSSETPFHVHAASAEVVRVPARELRVWGEVPSGVRVIELMRDEEAWEGTELDVGRTVL